MKKESGHGKKDQIEFEFQNPFFGEVIALFAKYEKHQCILDFHKITFKIKILAKNPYSSTSLGMVVLVNLICHDPFLMSDRHKWI